MEFTGALHVPTECRFVGLNGCVKVGVVLGRQRVVDEGRSVVVIAELNGRTASVFAADVDGICAEAVEHHC